MTTEQEQFWMGDFGDEYTKRNRVNWLQRVPFWTDIIAKTGANTVLEVGCNVGWNLLAIRLIKPRMDINGIEINNKARKQALALGLDVYYSYIEELSTFNNYKLVFTVGCLIHIPPEEIKTTMQSIIDHSTKYVLAVEYIAITEQEIEYRGHEKRLWKQPYGKMYQDMGLTLIETGELSREDGFDNCTYWLLEK